MKADLFERFITWAEKVARGPNGEPSSQRVAGLYATMLLGFAFVAGVAVFLLKGHDASFLELCKMFGIFALVALGLVTISKYGTPKGKPSDTPPEATP